MWLLCDAVLIRCMPLIIGVRGRRVEGHQGRNQDLMGVEEGLFKDGALPPPLKKIFIGFRLRDLEGSLKEIHRVPLKDPYDLSTALLPPSAYLRK